MAEPDILEAYMSDTAVNETKQAILNAVLSEVTFSGWTRRSLEKAVAHLDLPAGSDRLYFPNGSLEVIAFWSDVCDGQAFAHLTELDQRDMSVRDKVKTGVWARLQATGCHELATRRAMARLVLPDARGQWATQLWRSADSIWRSIGDQSIDGNYYSKRFILSSVLGASLISYLSDDMPDKAKSHTFLTARIENVMQFERFKRQAQTRCQDLPDMVKLLSCLRYGRSV